MPGRPQRTLERAGALEGRGLHTGEPCRVSFRPAPAGAGASFFRDGRPVERVFAGHSRCTAIGRAGAEIQTVEHAASALMGLGIDNVRVDVDGPEMPAMDGSAADFVNLFKGLGIADQREEVRVTTLTEPVFCHGEKSALAAFPAEDLSVCYALDFDFPGLRQTLFEVPVVTPEIYESQIAPARTFCAGPEAEALRAAGFGKGADERNTLVMTPDGPLGGSLRFSDECARHKALDLLGDLYFTGFPFAARIIGIRSGHGLNQQLAEAIKKQRSS
ncbi:MAG: hypothetical protein A3D28_04570 [Omnitrophica bacterium RIFCSPHIGHO2_02_FULL_63_14]|nr:MAG: hypothetical protein A3D28_04570 [Omnitrophica bacterium RIFCSPHIGHO2_02_FULL_63_14]